MTFSDKDKAILRYLTYPAQFSRPMKKGIERVFHMLIDPSIPFQSTAEFLQQTEGLRQLEEPFAEALTTQGHTENEIREFLESLANEIEIRYPNILRSGRPASRSGTWFQVHRPGYAKNFLVGDVLPNELGSIVLWEYQFPQVSMRAVDAIRFELVNYYKKSIINSTPEYEGAERHANASASRIRHHLTEPELENASILLEELSNAPNCPLIQEVQTLTEIKWLDDEVYRVWLQDVFHRISLNLERGIS